MKKKHVKKRESVVNEKKHKSPQIKRKKIQIQQLDIQQNHSQVKSHNIEHSFVFSPKKYNKGKKDEQNLSNFNKKDNQRRKSKKTNRINLQTKTQRYQPPEYQQNSKCTLRRDNYTERKDNDIRSPKRYKGTKIKHHKSISPRIGKKEDKKGDFKSPTKLNKSKSSGQVKIKKRKNMKVILQNNFFLIGDNFVQINEKLFQKFSEGLNNQSMIDRSNNFSQLENNIVRNERTQSTKINTLKAFEEVESQKEKVTEEKVDKEIYQDLSVESMIKEANSMQIQFLNKQSLHDIQNLIESPIKGNSEQKINEECEDSLEMRGNAANLQMKTRKQIIQRLHGSGKISQQQFMDNLDLIMECYDRQLNEIQALRNLIDKNSRRVEELVNKTKKDIVTAQTINQKPASDILNEIFGNERQKRRQSKMSSGEVDDFYENWNPNKKKFYSNNFSEQMTNYKECQAIKAQIEERVSVQMGIINERKQNSIKTSIASIFIFLRNFFAYFIQNYQHEFLKYINMPYGYSPEQRLLYMQGYDDQNIQSENNKIIYGLQEVIRTQILENFSKKYYQNCEETMLIEYQKIHNNLIFDALNESLNFFRPYFVINGPPYIWTSSEKALTFYHITQQNIDQVFQKTQIRVLKWAASLCGLILNQEDSSPQRRQVQCLQEILQKYNQENHEILLQHRENRLIKTQKIQVQETNYDWSFIDEQKTAVLYQISSLLLEEFSSEVTNILIKKSMDDGFFCTQN